MGLYNTSDLLTSRPAIEGLEEQLQKASELKALHKSALSKLALQRASQRVYPTFDVNPLVVKEFLDKAISNEHGLSPDGLIFESLQRSESSIKDAGQEKLADDTMSDQPTSFAQALLSKLNVAGETAIASPVPTRKHHTRAISSISSIRTESQGPSRGPSPAKPEPSARNGVSPSGLPPSRNGAAGSLQGGDIAVPDRTGPLLSYIRSLIEKDGTCHTRLGFLGILTDDQDLSNAAREAGIPRKGPSEIRHISSERKEAERQRNRDRDTVGEVDTLKGILASHPDTGTTNGDAAPLTEAVTAFQGDVAQKENGIAINGVVGQVKQVARKAIFISEEDRAVNVGKEESRELVAAPGESRLLELVGDAVVGNMNGASCTLDGAQETRGDVSTLEVPTPIESTTIMTTPASIPNTEAPSQQQVLQPAHPGPTALNHVAKGATVPPEDDSSSDDEVVVFNPRSKRLSQTKASLQPAKTTQVPQTPKVPKQYEAPSKGGPALIDPDAFGRTFARKPSGVALNAGRTLAARSPRASPRHSPQRSIATPEPADVDFVLKSGSPRGAARGKGKLWVP